ncbi:MAG: MBOAT family protein [Lachnospiraceae bacterium]|nr:MBOAT family protein [Lachnospiraceae bacterium]
MSFISLRFVTFFFILLIVMRMTKKKETQHIVLLAASYIFYALGDIRFLGLLFLMSLLVWWLGLAIQNDDNKKKPLIIGVVIALCSLVFFKYFNFFVESFARILGQHSVHTLKIILPIGISFYIFQAISYLADVYYGKVQARKSVVDILLYIGFFPQIVSGPIVKAHDFFPQLEERHVITKEKLSYGLQLILIGLFKKVVIADRLGVCVNSVYSAPSAYSGPSLLCAVIAYAIQIYCDFSGYSDMAIGVAHILGFDLGKNFNLPYIASNPSEFWKRWHISLSSWFRDYVYIPLGGNRRGEFRTYFNLFITMLLSGLWHGASWMFILWGALYGVTSVIHKFYCKLKKDKTEVRRPLNKGLAVIFNTAIVWLFWIPFRAGNLETTWLITSRIFTMASGISYIYVFTIIYTLIIMGYQVFCLVTNKGDNLWRPLNLNKFSSQVIICVFVLLTIVFAYVGDTAFIYAQF